MAGIDARSRGLRAPASLWAACGAPPGADQVGRVLLTVCWRLLLRRGSVGWSKITFVAPWGVVGAALSALLGREGARSPRSLVARAGQLLSGGPFEERQTWFLTIEGIVRCTRGSGRLQLEAWRFCNPGPVAHRARSAGRGRSMCGVSASRNEPSAIRWDMAGSFPFLVVCR